MEQLKAKANPTKAFFVRMITRDISLTDCVLDLIDNSIDGAWQLEGAPLMTLSTKTRLSKYRINIEANETRFTISDNCGGITLTDAAEYAFTFGRRDSDPHDKYSIGVYGIGMKRAVFKMGTNIRIRSTYRKKNGETESFAVPINVTKWMANETTTSWDFDIDADTPLEVPGVEITVRALTDGTKTSFGDPAFIQNLRRIIARDYALHLHRGLVITLNGNEIKEWHFILRESRLFSPMREDYKAAVKKLVKKKTVNGIVKITIVAGMAAAPPDSGEPDEQGDAESSSGWYIVCNGRIVLASDKSPLSGWGTNDWPKWHPQYAGFIGVVLFTSEDAALLPLTTTKRSVDVSSSVFRRMLPHMREVSKTWINYTNVRKQARPEAKLLEDQTKPLAIFDVKKRSAMALPRLTPKPRVKGETISYTMPTSRVRSLALGFGNINLSGREVGVASFEYAYSELAEEE